MSVIFAIDHCSVLVRDLERALDFYRNVLELPINSARPDIGFPGAWLHVGNQSIHLLELPNPDPVEERPAHAGRDRHVALLVRELAAVQTRLERHGVPYTHSRSGRAALFCRDPDGNGIELIQYDPATMRPDDQP